jgi:hypothetical protein
MVAEQVEASKSEVAIATQLWNAKLEKKTQELNDKLGREVQKREGEQRNEERIEGQSLMLWKVLSDHESSSKGDSSNFPPETSNDAHSARRTTLHEAGPASPRIGVHASGLVLERRE